MGAESRPSPCFHRTPLAPAPGGEKEGRRGQGPLLLLLTVIAPGSGPSCVSSLSSPAGQLLLQRFILGSEGFFEDTVENQGGRLISPAGR